MHRRLTVPGNLLLLGEYAVTEPGGLGVAIGSGPRLRASARSVVGRTLRIRALLGTTELCWPDDPLPLADATVELSQAEGVDTEGVEIELDSRDFFEGSRKLGFGSSAAAAVALAALILDTVDPERVFPLALSAHRRMQNGRGSGYDLAASTYGGLIRFVGGAQPEVSPLELHWLPRLYAVAGQAPVQSGGAVGSYSAWKRANPEAAGRFVEQSNANVRDFLRSTTWAEAVTPLAAARSLGEDLGDEIGVPARFAPRGAPRRDLSDSDAFVKAVGAGDELGVLFTPDPQQFERIGTVAELDHRARGASWE